MVPGIYSNTEPTSFAVDSAECETTRLFACQEVSE